MIKKALTSIWNFIIIWGEITYNARKQKIRYWY